MILHSIRFRLQLWHGLILLAVLGGFGAMAYRMAWEDAMRGVDRELEQRMAGLFRPMGPPPMMAMMPPPMPPRDGHPLPPFDPRGGKERLLAALEEAAAGGNSYFYRFVDGGGAVLKDTPRPEGATREVVRSLPFGDRLTIGRSIEPELGALRTFALSLAAAGLALLAIGLAGGWWLASRAIRPIDTISATAARIAEGDLSQRVPLAETENELGQLAAVLNSTFERLEASFQRQARFTADASHELRTPVTVILSQIQLSLARERTAAEYKEALLACQRAARRMRKLTESLLALTRLDAGQETIRRDRFLLSQVAEESVELVRARADERGIRLHCDLPATECTGDADRVAQVVTNLVTNAIQSTPSGGEVRITTSRNGTGAELVVSDNGEGIPAAALPLVFDRFYRADKARAAANGGAGLGLSICQSIVQAHGGTIGVRSEPGKGAEFTVTLPDQ